MDKSDFSEAPQPRKGEEPLLKQFLILRGWKNLRCWAGNTCIEECFPSRAAFSHQYYHTVLFGLSLDITQFLNCKNGQNKNTCRPRRLTLPVSLGPQGARAWRAAATGELIVDTSETPTLRDSHLDGEPTCSNGWGSSHIVTKAHLTM